MMYACRERERHTVANVTRTSMFLDRDLVREAARVLGTDGVTDTVHEALNEVVRMQLRRELLAGDPTFGVTLEELLERRRREGEH
jgi:Arc/MetJ family transcription regulator